ncbi:MAG: ChbG/HpnK family deacetylase [Candidatus Omnitrophota bacterium]|jgi:predicted glycoside hydrolase/deacetylase ChbG (UPF0249 family)
MKRLIVNADDCNLTKAVTEAILDCHGRGIVSSTTFLINLPLRSAQVKRLKARKSLGVGLHLNVTLGQPLSAPEEVRSLTGAEGEFLGLRRLLVGQPVRQEVFGEYCRQIDRFRKVFGRLPTHLDTHHQMHDRSLFLEALVAAAKRYKLPVRRSRSMEQKRRAGTPDFLFGSLDPACSWTGHALTEVLRNLPEGTSEIMCHPGQTDVALKAISSMTSARDREYRIFCQSRFRKMLGDLGVFLTHYGLCYNAEKR